MINSKYGLDANTIIEQFFICEFSKRVYELSNLRNDDLQKSVDFVIEIFDQENITITRDFASLFLDELIYYAEKADFYVSAPINYPMVEPLYIKIYKFLEKNKYLYQLLQISLRFRVPYGSLYYPYNMKSLYKYYNTKNELPLQLIMRNDVKKFEVLPTNNQISFRVPNSMNKCEMINYLNESVNLYYNLIENNNIDYSDVNDIFMNANEKSYRQTENNIKNIILGLYIYDILLINELGIDDIVDIYQKYLCDSSFCISKFKTKQFMSCTIKSKCKDNIRKQFTRVDKRINDFFKKYGGTKLPTPKYPLMNRYETDYDNKALSDFYKKVSNRGD